MAIYRWSVKLAWIWQSYNPENTGTEWQVLTKTNSWYAYCDIPQEIPSGWTEWQVLTKTADWWAWCDSQWGWWLKMYKINSLIVWAWGWGWWLWWWGGWQIKCCSWILMYWNSVWITVWAWGSWSNSSWCRWWHSCLLLDTPIVSCWWYWWTIACWWNAWWWSPSWWTSYTSVVPYFWWWWWAWQWQWWSAWLCNCWFRWWQWFYWYWWWGGGWGRQCWWLWQCWWGNGWYWMTSPTSPTACWWGWGWGNACASDCTFNSGSNWAGWVVIVCYKTDWSFGINSATGWTVTTEWDYTVHTFTSNWTFCITW